MIERLHLSLLVLDEPKNVQVYLEELERSGIDAAVNCVGRRQDDFLAALNDSPDVILVPAGALARIRDWEFFKSPRERPLSPPVVMIAEAARDQPPEAIPGAAGCVPRDRLSRLAPALLRAHFESRLSRSKESRGGQPLVEAAWDHSSDAMRLTDRGGLIRAVNPAYCEMVGMSDRDLIGRSFTVVYPEDGDLAQVRARHARRFHEGLPAILEERRACFPAAGREIDVEITYKRIALEKGGALLLTVLRDIGERKRKEGEFLRNQRIECIGALAGGIAHDFNNVLAPVFMASSILRTPLSSDDFEQALGTIEDSGRRGAEIVRRLVRFARGVEGERRPLQPAGLVREIAAMAERTFPRNITVEARISPDLWEVEGNRTQLHQVLLNLCLNARDAMPDGGRLFLEARNRVIDSGSLPPSPHARGGPFVLLAVSDTGPGIPPGDAGRIFDPFHSTRVAEGGTGIGLATSLALVRSHSGYIAVESGEGRGACFGVYLPALGKPD